MRNIQVGEFLDYSERRSWKSGKLASIGSFNEKSGPGEGEGKYEQDNEKLFYKIEIKPNEF